LGDGGEHGSILLLDFTFKRQANNLLKASFAARVTAVSSSRLMVKIMR